MHLGMVWYLGGELSIWMISNKKEFPGPGSVHNKISPDVRLARPRAHSEPSRRRQWEVPGANLGANKMYFGLLGWTPIPVCFSRLLAPLHFSLFFELQHVGCTLPCHRMVMEGWVRVTRGRGASCPKYSLLPAQNIPCSLL